MIAENGSQPVAIVRRTGGGPGNIQGAIAGSAFPIARDKVVTCWHILKKIFDSPTQSNQSGWLFSKGDKIIRFRKDDVSVNEMHDIAIISLSELFSLDEIYELSEFVPEIGQSCLLSGYFDPPQRITLFDDRGSFDPELQHVYLEYAEHHCHSAVQEIIPDVQGSPKWPVTDITLIQSGCDGRVGMSGSPLTDATTGRVLGIHALGRDRFSIQFPPIPVGTEPLSFAISAAHIRAML